MAYYKFSFKDSENKRIETNSVHIHDGKDTLVLYDIIRNSEEQFKYLTIPLSSFNRKPEVGDNFFCYWITNTNTYLCQYKVNEVEEMYETPRSQCENVRVEKLPK